MSNYLNAGAGLRKMYIAAIGVTVCGVLVNFPFVGVLSSLGVLGFAVLDFIGYYEAGKDIQGCRDAFILRIIAIVISMLSGFVEVWGGTGINVAYSLGKNLFSVLPVCLVFTSVAKVFRENENSAMAKKGMIAMGAYLACYVGLGIMEIASLLLAQESNVGKLLLIILITVVLSIVALIFQLRFYKQSAECFGVYF